LHRPVYQLADIKTTEYFDTVPAPFKSESACQVDGIVPIDLGHITKLVHPLIIKLNNRLKLAGYYNILTCLCIDCCYYSITGGLTNSQLSGTLILTGVKLRLLLVKFS
jgi:hypothetical protein